MGDNDFFTVVKVKELQPDDFYLGSDTPTKLKNRDATIVLFYVPDDPTSEELKDIWAALGNELAGMSFAAVNGSRQTAVMKAFVETGSDPDHPLFPFKVAGFPTIMVFRDGWPQAFYNGERSYDDLLAYAMELAWKVGYYEPNNSFVGVAPGRPDLVAYERRTSGDQYASDYIEQLSEREPRYTPEDEPGVLLTEEEAEEEEAIEGGDEPVESEDVGSVPSTPE
jgi:hypothetical protein